MINNVKDYFETYTREDQHPYYEPIRDSLIWQIIALYPEEKETLVWRKDLSPDVIYYLANDTSENIRTRIAQKNQLPEPLFFILFNDPSLTVRGRIGFNKNTSVEMRAALLQDEDEGIRQLAEIAYKKTLGKKLKVQHSRPLESNETEILIDVQKYLESLEAGHDIEQIESNTAWMIIKHYPDYKSQLASHNIPREIMFYLANDSDWKVRHQLAQNPELPKELFIVFKHDEHQMVRECMEQMLK